MMTDIAVVVKLIGTVIAAFGCVAVATPDERTRGLDPRIGRIAGWWMFGALLLAIWLPYGA